VVLDTVTVTARSFSLEITEGGVDLLALLPFRIERVVEQKLYAICAHVVWPWIAYALMAITATLCLYIATHGISVVGALSQFLIVGALLLWIVWLVLGALMCSVALSCTRNPQAGVIWGLGRFLLVMAGCVLIPIFGGVVTLPLVLLFWCVWCVCDRRTLDREFANAASNL
jgi:hypothetical protein